MLLLLQDIRCCSSAGSVTSIADNDDDDCFRCTKGRLPPKDRREAPLLDVGAASVQQLLLVTIMAAAATMTAVVEREVVLMLVMCVLLSLVVVVVTLVVIAFCGWLVAGVEAGRSFADFGGLCEKKRKESQQRRFERRESFQRRRNRLSRRRSIIR
jgi:hypothetical protein